MHRYRIVARISLLLSILNLVLAAPIAVRGIHEARDDNSNEAQDMAAVPKKSGELEDKTTSLPSSSNEKESLQDPPSPSGSMSSGYSYDLPLSSDLGPSDPLASYAWLLDKPWHLRLHPPSSLDESGSPHPSSSGLPEIQIPEWFQEFGPEIPPSPHLPATLHDPASPHPSNPGSPGIPFSAWLAPEIPPSPPGVWHGLMPPLPHIPSSGSSEISLSQQDSGSDPGATETYSQPDEFSTSSHPGHPSSFSSMDSMPWYPGDSASPTSETPSDNAKFLNKNMMKKIGIVTGMAIVGGTIATVVGSQIKKHHKHRDCQDT